MILVLLGTKVLLGAGVAVFGLSSWLLTAVYIASNRIFTEVKTLSQPARFQRCVSLFPFFPFLSFSFFSFLSFLSFLFFEGGKEQYV